MAKGKRNPARMKKESRQHVPRSSQGLVDRTLGLPSVGGVVELRNYGQTRYAGTGNGADMFYAWNPNPKKNERTAVVVISVKRDQITRVDERTYEVGQHSHKYISAESDDYASAITQMKGIPEPQGANA